MSRLRLYCLPFAGGGASTYRGWTERVSPTLDVRPIQLPGRESRRSEPPIDDMEALVEHLADAVEEDLDLGRGGWAPFALMGHSMGGVVAFELARELRWRHGLSPEHLIVSASPAPHLPLGRAPLHTRDDDGLVDYLRELDGTPEKLFERRWLLKAYLPPFRADLTAFETRVFVPDAPLACPSGASS